MLVVASTGIPSFACELCVNARCSRSASRKIPQLEFQIRQVFIKDGLGQSPSPHHYAGSSLPELLLAELVMHFHAPRDLSRAS